MIDMIDKIALVRGLFEGYGPRLASKLYFTACGNFGYLWERSGEERARILPMTQ